MSSLFALVFLRVDDYLYETVNRGGYKQFPLSIFFYILKKKTERENSACPVLFVRDCNIISDPEVKKKAKF